MMLTDVAFRVGQTLTASVNLPASATYRTAEAKPGKSLLRRVFELPVWFARQVIAERKLRNLEKNLRALPDSVLNDLNLNRHQFNDESMMDRFLTGHDARSLINGWYR